MERGGSHDDKFLVRPVGRCRAARSRRRRALAAPVTVDLRVEGPRRHARRRTRSRPTCGTFHFTGDGDPAARLLPSSGTAARSTAPTARRLGRALGRVQATSSRRSGASATPPRPGVPLRDLLVVLGQRSTRLRGARARCRSQTGDDVLFFPSCFGDGLRRADAAADHVARRESAQPAQPSTARRRSRSPTAGSGASTASAAAAARPGPRAGRVVHGAAPTASRRPDGRSGRGAVGVTNRRGPACARPPSSVCVDAAPAFAAAGAADTDARRPPPIAGAARAAPSTPAAGRRGVLRGTRGGRPVRAARGQAAAHPPAAASAAAYFSGSQASASCAMRCGHGSFFAHRRPRRLVLPAAQAARPRPLRARRARRSTARSTAATPTRVRVPGAMRRAPPCSPPRSSLAAPAAGRARRASS